MPERESYDDTIQYLFGLQKHGIKLGLSNTRELMEMLGHPQRSFRAVHLAGTNGKGSTASMIASMLAAHGTRTGLFTSPHLVSFTERISIDGERITEKQVIDLTRHIRSAINGHSFQPTFFEFVTAMAFLFFRTHDAKWAVIETGMGGRLDATNVIEPEVSVITSIGLDHMEFLGESISDITHEKAGIIKTHIPVVTSVEEGDALAAIKSMADQNDASLHIYKKHFTGKLKSEAPEGIVFNYSGYADYRDLKLPLIGGYQMTNACTAVRTLEVIGNSGYPLSEDMIRSGLRDVEVEGRMEKVEDNPAVFIDGAHNPDAAFLTVEHLKHLFPDKKIIIVAGIMRDKDIPGIVKPLLESAETLIVTHASYERSASSMLLQNVASSLKPYSGGATILHSDSVSGAIALAKKISSKDNIILITGSFYTAGEAKEYFGHPAILPGLREK